MLFNNESIDGKKRSKLLALIEFSIWLFSVFNFHEKITLGTLTLTNLIKRKINMITENENK